VGSTGVGFAHSRRQRDPDGTQGEARGGTWGGAYHEALAVLLDFGLSQRIQIGDDLRPRAERPSAAIRSSGAFFSTRARKLQNTWPRLVEDRPSREEMLGGTEGLLHGPQLLVAMHGVERIEIGVGAQHEDAVANLLSSSILSESPFVPLTLKKRGKEADYEAKTVTRVGRR